MAVGPTLAYQLPPGTSWARTTPGHVEAAVSQGPDVGGENASPEEIQAALAGFGARVEPELTTVREARRAGDEAAFDRVDTYMLAECGYEQIEVTAGDHEFQGLPDDLAAGVVGVTLVNEGAELHEIGIARIADEVARFIPEGSTAEETEVSAPPHFTLGMVGELPVR